MKPLQMLPVHYLFLAVMAVMCVSRVDAADLIHGQQIAKNVCSGCHAPDGNSQVPMFPKLAGLNDQYLLRQLVDLAKPPGDRGGRQNDMMSPIAMSLSDTDRRDVTAFFASQKLQLAATGAPPPDAELGRVIFRTGLAGRSVPACAGCHGPSAAGLPILYPRIGGQYGDYLVAQLKAFRDGTRRNSTAMHDIAFRMSDPEMSAVAAYAASLGAQ